MEPGTYGTDGTDPEEASGLLEPEDTLDDARGVRDVLDTGWSPPERPWAVDDWGTTEAEELAGESLDGRLARELPDGVPDDGDGLGDTSDTDGELLEARSCAYRVLPCAARFFCGDAPFTTGRPRKFDQL